MKLSVAALIDHVLHKTLYELQYEYTGATSEACARIKESGQTLLEAMTTHPDLNTEHLFGELSILQRAVRECSIETEGLNRLNGLLSVCLDIHEEGKPQFGVPDYEDEEV